MDPNFDFLHNMGRVGGSNFFRVEREAMCHGKIPEFLVFNKQEETYIKQHRILSL